MDQYTTLNEHEIEQILAKFSIDNISSSKILSGGSENTNYFVKAENGSFVLSICEQKSLEQSKDLAKLLEHLANNHFETSRLAYTTNRETVIDWKGKPILVKHYLEGRIIKDLSSSLLILIGQEIAKLHEVEAPVYLPTQLNYEKEAFAKINDRDANSPFHHWLRSVTEYTSPYFRLKLPKALIHSDVFWDNVIISNDENTIRIMDFEEAAYYYRVFDIGMTIIGICAEGEVINMEKAKHLLQGYQSVIQLSDDEISALKAFTIYAGASMTFWRHQNFRYVKPDPKMFNHYLGLKVLVDFVSAQEEDCFAKLLSN